jgi:hypothetical protein
MQTNIALKLALTSTLTGIVEREINYGAGNLSMPLINAAEPSLRIANALH